ncbi:Protein kinase-like domain protein [Zalerion maritima]|uniref:Protein kinase-like domain protein n=1 Tax=Zalerion maritima TaxID=339359 RepID=A0AAD5RHY5_9PEZI|nr:Protein kinase-like domain protein [Zalerion maritima]
MHWTKDAKLPNTARLLGPDILRPNSNSGSNSSFVRKISPTSRQKRPSLQLWVDAPPHKRSRLVYRKLPTMVSSNQGPATSPRQEGRNAIANSNMDPLCGPRSQLRVTGHTPPNSPSPLSTTIRIQVDDDGSPPPAQFPSEYQSLACVQTTPLGFEQPEDIPRTPPYTPPRGCAGSPIPDAPGPELDPEPSLESILEQIPKPVTPEFLQSQCRPVSRSPRQDTLWAFRDSVFIKYGPQVHDSEAITMLMLAGSGVPVPALYDYYRHPETGYWCILMRFVRGCQTLEEAHVSGELLGLDGSSGRALLDQITIQLADIMSTLRGVKSARGIGSVAAIATESLMSGDTAHMDGESWDAGAMRNEIEQLGPVHDHFFSTSHLLHGPFSGPSAHRDFTSDIADAVQDRVLYEHQLDVLVDLMSVFPAVASEETHIPEGFVLTHGELVPKHILVDSTGVRCIVDWSNSGFFPEYWEYMKAQFGDGGCSCLLEKVLDGTAAISTPLPHSRMKRLDLILRPSVEVAAQASVLLGAKNIIF